MTDTAKPAKAVKSDARQAARDKRAALVVETQLAEEAQMAATIAAVEAKIETMNEPPAGVVIRGNQGR